MFATVDELAEELEVTFTESQERKAFRRLESATGAIQEFTHLTISKVTGDVVPLTGNWGRRLVLPEVPVSAVSSVVIDGETLTSGEDYTFDGIRTIYRGVLESPLLDTIEREPAGEGHWGGPECIITVTYTHGWDPIPPVVRGICLAMAARGWSAPTGVQQETIGGYSVTYGTSAVSGANVLLPGEKRTMANLRRQWLEGVQ